MRIFSKQYSVISLACVAYTALFNFAFFSRFHAIFPHNQLILVSAAFLIWAIHFLLLSVIATEKLTKPILITGFVGGAISAYFSYSYGVVIDTDMLLNTLQTDTEEARGLISFTLIASVLIGGIIPSYMLVLVKFPPASFKRAVIAKLGAITVSIAVALSSIYPFSADYSTFLREHKGVRYFVTPITPIYSLLQIAVEAADGPFEKPGQPGRVIADDMAMGDDGSHELMILIVGETVRADHLSLNGYEKKTNPKLEATEHIVSFTNFHSCGTATAVSVPCMFSPDDRAEFSGESIFTKENILDVLSRQDVAILWRDNNSSSKGVADRVTYESFKHPDANPYCDTECRDEGMLSGLDEYIAQHQRQDILIVLHAMGSHGPEYYKRYPETFEHFKPSCRTNQLSECTPEELNNSYDNSVLYADQFIADSIDFLKTHSDYETFLLYISDHGESLGEQGVYLHGLPYSLAPESQTHVAALAWLPPNSDFDFEATLANADKPYSHDDLFCSMLIAYEIATNFCSGKERILVSAEEGDEEESGNSA